MAGRRRGRRRNSLILLVGVVVVGGGVVGLSVLDNTAGPDRTVTTAQCTGTDTDGDGLNDCTEQRWGTNPKVADTDDDGLNDSAELRAHTDPKNPDSDGDGYLDGAEYRNETSDGVPLPNADPRTMDLYVTVVTNESGPPLSQSLRANVTEQFATMPVDNPDGSQGVDLHFVPNDLSPYDGKVWLGDDEQMRATQRSLAGNRSNHYKLIILTDIERVAGYSAMTLPPTDETEQTVAAVESRTDIVFVHELLHLIVGVLDERNQCERIDHPTHMCHGILSPSATTGAMPAGLAEEIESEGMWRHLRRS